MDVLCNTGEWETIGLLLGPDPILSEFRRLYFGRTILEEKLLDDILIKTLSTLHELYDVYKYVLLH